MTPIKSMKLPEYKPVPETRDKHSTGDCRCKRFIPSGRRYMGWPACATCMRLPRKKP